jgi:methylated-DNA-[protein]-cysteine S-methyltransferase
MSGMGLAWTVVGFPQPIGALTIAASEAGVALVCFGDGAGARRRVGAAARRLGLGRRAVRVHPPAVTRADDGVAELVDHAAAELVDHAAAELVDYGAGRRREFSVPVDWRLTTGDQRTVLTTLLDTVGYGHTITYGELAVRAGVGRGGHPGLAAQRVGAIMGSNPIPVIVPCHRVVAADGLGGFGGGLAAKRCLLDLEQALPPTLDLDIDERAVRAQP